MNVAMVTVSATAQGLCDGFQSWMLFRLGVTLVPMRTSGSTDPGT